MFDKNRSGKPGLSHPPSELFQRYLRREILPAREKIGLKQISESLARTLRMLERRCRVQNDITWIALDAAEREALAEGIRSAVTDRSTFSLAYTDFIKRRLPAAYQIPEWRISGLANEILDHGLSFLNGKISYRSPSIRCCSILLRSGLYSRLCAQDLTAAEWRRDAPVLSV